jgi:hypothetical protein
VTRPPRTTKRVPGTVGDQMPPAAPKTSARAEGWSKKSYYRPLPKEFRHNGFIFRQIARTKNAAIYEQTWNGCSNPSVCYEVVRIRRREGFKIGGRFVEAGEVYPNSEAWGTDGFTLTDRGAAFAKLRETINFQKKESANPVKKSPIQKTNRCLETTDLCGDVKNRCDG